MVFLAKNLTDSISAKTDLCQFLAGVQTHPPLQEGRVLLHAPRKRDFLKKHASKGRAIKPAPPGGAGWIARPFWRGGGVGVRGGEGSAIIIALSGAILQNCALTAPLPCSVTGASRTTP
ncbi:hypothetical protein PGT21_015581 [Puccinia graminis f. sp. tritici]|uniref:Uncharacterized protein n=1 Tax=Puccinia graminis f. sp. tritici TaxID=56615 RepID=A0A5B0MNQ7_PUCGR|nr:hypothetical protein PGT21_015581 [Puccinia graminis f. sp. tritici]